MTYGIFLAVFLNDTGKYFRLGCRYSGRESNQTPPAYVTASAKVLGMQVFMVMIVIVITIIFVRTCEVCYRGH